MAPPGGCRPMRSAVAVKRTCLYTRTAFGTSARTTAASASVTRQSSCCKRSSAASLMTASNSCRSKTMTKTGADRRHAPG